MINDSDAMHHFGLYMHCMVVRIPLSMASCPETACLHNHASVGPQHLMPQQMLHGEAWHLTTRCVICCPSVLLVIVLQQRILNGQARMLVPVRPLAIHPVALVLP